jgi:hypothetical protein
MATHKVPDQEYKDVLLRGDSRAIMSDSEKPEGTLSEADGVYVDDEGELTAEMESLQKSGSTSGPDE